MTPEERCPGPDSTLAAACLGLEVEEHAGQRGRPEEPQAGYGAWWGPGIGAQMNAVQAPLISSLSFLSSRSGYFNSPHLVLRAIVGEAKREKGGNKF